MTCCAPLVKKGGEHMKLLGISYTTNPIGEIVSTLHLVADFEAYYSNKEAGRGCIGNKVETVYVGNYDCSTLSVGDEIDIFYDRAVTTKKGGTFQPIKYIEIIK